MDVTRARSELKARFKWPCKHERGSGATLAAGKTSTGLLMEQTRRRFFSWVSGSRQQCETNTFAGALSGLAWRFAASPARNAPASSHVFASACVVHQAPQSSVGTHIDSLLVLGVRG